jgi:hypothetical protein
MRGGRKSPKTLIQARRHAFFIGGTMTVVEIEVEEQMTVEEHEEMMIAVVDSDRALVPRIRLECLGIWKCLAAAMHRDGYCEGSV